MSILQIKEDVRKQFSKLSLKSMLPMITLKRELHNAGNDTIIIVLTVNIVSIQLLKEIEYWKSKGASDEDVIC